MEFQGAEQDRIDHAEDRGVGADAPARVRMAVAVKPGFLASRRKA